jgi:hypothetical protein
LASLYDRIRGRMWDEPSFDRLQRRPGDVRARQDLERAIAKQAQHDRSFQSELARTVAELDRMGGRNYLHIEHVEAPGYGAQVGHIRADRGGVAGIISGGVHIRHPSELDDFRESGPIVKTLTVVATLLALTGFGIFGYTLLTVQPDLNSPDFMELPDGIKLGAGLFFAGLVTGILAGLGNAMRRR